MSSPKSQILLLGASGRTGQLVLAEALSRGHSVTALVRKAASLTPASNLTIIEGSPLQHADVEKAISSLPKDFKIVVVSTLAQTRVSGNPWSVVTSPKRLMADSMENVIAVGKATGRIDKVVAMSMFGTGTSMKNMAFFMRWTMYGSNMDVTVEDHNLVDQAVRASGLKYVLVRAAMLKGEETLPVKELGDDGERAGWMPSVSRKSVMGFLLDTVESDRWDGRTPVISN